MANVRTIQVAFSGGEMSPEMYGLLEDTKRKNGLKTCRNFVPRPQGPAENRPGTEFVYPCKYPGKKARLIPFTFSVTDTMILEFGDLYIRFHSQGQTLMTDGTLDTPASGKTPYEVVTPYTEATVMDLHYVQSADVLTIVHPVYAPRELRRSGAVSWTLTTINFNPTINPPGDAVVTVTPPTAGTANDYQYQYVVTSIGADGIQESIKSGDATATPVNISAITKANPCKVTTAANHNLAKGDKILISSVGGMTELNGNYYLVKGVPSATEITLNSLSGTAVNSSAFGTYTSGGAVTPAFVKNNIFQTGAKNTIEWSPVAGATGYNVYKFVGGNYGYIGQAQGTQFVDDNIDADLSKTPPLYDTVFNGAGEYPGAVSYYEQRRCFAGSVNKPQNIWMTKSGTESNMSYSLPIRDDDRIAVRVAAREANVIRHLVPLQQLVPLTSAAEWRVTSVNNDAITPTSISVRPQSYVGSNNVQPVLINNTMVYCAARGGHVRELGYNWQANGYITGDLSLRATHLFDNLDIVDMAYAKAPNPIVWFVSSSGDLLGLTYIPEQEIGAWHRHDTDGVFESCAVIAEGTEDRLYVVVRREVDGSTVRYVERMASRLFSAQADAWFVDCGLSYDGALADTISGLDHLEGKTVSILADGAVHPQRVVAAGAVQLDVEVSKAIIGLPIKADLETLPLALAVDNGAGQGRMKNVNKVWLRVVRSSGIFCGPDEGHLTEAKQRTTEPYGSPPALKSDEIQIVLTPAWSTSGSVFIRQSDPLPLTVVNITAEVAIGG